MAAPQSGPCEPWTTPEEVRACCDGLDPLFDLTEVIAYVSEVLFRLSARRFPGVCLRTIRPCIGDNCSCGNWGGSIESRWYHYCPTGWGYGLLGLDGVGYGPGWIGAGPGGAFSLTPPCCCDGCYLPCVDLPAPVIDVVEVVIDGAILDPAAYKIDAYRRVCRVDGNGWPCGNDLTAEACVTTDEVLSATVDATAGQWSITVTIGGVSQVANVNATDGAAAVQAAVEALTNVGVGNVTVSGGPGDAGGTTPYVLTFDVAALGAVPGVAFGDVSLAGGAATVTPTVIFAGCFGGLGTWEIIYEYGRPVPPGGRLAAAMFACQVALARCGGEGCTLPQRLTQLSRQDVTLTFQDSLDFIETGRTGIYEVDMWLHSVNPAGLARPASLHRADQRKRSWKFT